MITPESIMLAIVANDQARMIALVVIVLAVITVLVINVMIVRARARRLAERRRMIAVELARCP